MMTYSEAIDFLYSQTPQFQQIGAAAYKPGLETVTRLAERFGNPQNSYSVIHVGGTNGKGSTSHTLAAVLQSAGYKVGLYTSPHLVDFRERMRVDGRMIPHDKVLSFMERYGQMTDMHSLRPSFFELTTVMAFDWFSHENVDVAVIEVGLGGRLDSTNIVNPALSVITNVSFDHMAQLGNTLKSIAHEKSGIMRENVDVICGETDSQVRKYFEREAIIHKAPITFACDEGADYTFRSADDFLLIGGTPFGELHYQLTGDCQRQNSRTVLSALSALRKKGWKITDEAVRHGFSQVCDMTGLAGRWMKISSTPCVICDTGHNIGGWELLSRQLATLPRPLTVILGFVNDKDIAPILPLLPEDARYIFTRASVPRALRAEELAAQAARVGLEGECVPTVGEAYEKALREHSNDSGHGSVFIGGSTFVVADLLKYLESKHGA